MHGERRRRALSWLQGLRPARPLCVRRGDVVRTPSGPAVVTGLELEEQGVVPESAHARSD